MAATTKKTGAKAKAGAKSGAKAKTRAKAEKPGADDLLMATLAHVPFDGWSEQALTAAAADCGMGPAEVAAIFPDGPVSAIEAFTSLADREMARGLDKLATKPQGITAIVRAAILVRLEWAGPHREAVTASLKILKHPRHGAVAMRTLYRTVDSIWRLTGDRAVDFSFYTKRATLAAIYSATLFYWASNPNAKPGAVEAFLDRRLAELKLIPKVTAPARKAAEAGFKMAARVLERMPVRNSG